MAKSSNYKTAQKEYADRLSNLVNAEAHLRKLNKIRQYINKATSEHTISRVPILEEKIVEVQQSICGKIDYLWYTNESKRSKVDEQMNRHDRGTELEAWLYDIGHYCESFDLRIKQIQVNNTNSITLFCFVSCRIV